MVRLQRPSAYINLQDLERHPEVISRHVRNNESKPMNPEVYQKPWPTPLVPSFEYAFPFCFADSGEMGERWAA